MRVPVAENDPFGAYAASLASVGEPSLAVFVSSRSEESVDPVQDQRSQELWEPDAECPTRYGDDGDAMHGDLYGLRSS